MRARWGSGGCWQLRNAACLSTCVLAPVSVAPLVSCLDCAAPPLVLRCRGLSGPHDAGHYNSSSWETTFFVSEGGSWSTPYGHFFLAWYSGLLANHAQRILTRASEILNSAGRPRVFKGLKEVRQLVPGVRLTVESDGSTSAGMRVTPAYWFAAGQSRQQCDGSSTYSPHLLKPFAVRCPCLLACAGCRRPHDLRVLTCMQARHQACRRALVVQVTRPCGGAHGRILQHTRQGRVSAGGRAAGLGQL